eukprot:297513-Amorphochlora_amoeboformis.AAC.1
MLMMTLNNTTFRNTANPLETYLGHYQSHMLRHNCYDTMGDPIDWCLMVNPIDCLPSWKAIALLNMGATETAKARRTGRRRFPTTA